MYIIPFYYYFFWRSLSFVTRRKVVDGGRVVEVRIFIGTIHLRDDEKYGKKQKFSSAWSTGWSSTHSRNVMRRLLLFFLLLYLFPTCNPWKIPAVSHQKIIFSFFFLGTDAYRVQMRNHGNDGPVSLFKGIADIIQSDTTTVYSGSC